MIMNNKPLALTIDFGTQSVRAMIFNLNGDTLAIEKRAYKPAYFSLKPGYAEQNPNYYWERMCEATQAIAKNHPDLLLDVQTMAMCCFRDSPVILDKDMKVIRPAILWLDQRQALKKPQFGFLRTALFSTIGLTEMVTINAIRTPARWLQEAEPDNWAKTKHYVSISTYLTYLLTGKLIDSISNYAGHYPIDLKSGKLLKHNDLKAPIFNTPGELLPEIIKQGEQIGTISHECFLESGIPEGLPIYAGGSDKASETIGTGCINNDMASISYGTASSIEVTNPKYIEPAPFLPAYPAAIPGLFNMELQVYRGYWMVTWFKNEFAASESAEAEIVKMATEDILNKAMMKIKPGSDGLVLQPYWGPGFTRPEAKGAIIGWSDCHTHMHLYRAIVEGIAYELREGLENIEKRQHRQVKELRISGGGSQSDAICQITADIFGLPVSRVQTYETSSLGTAIAAFTAHGDFPSYDKAVEAMVHKSVTFLPDFKDHKTYDYLFHEVYVKLYGRLKPMYKKLRSFNG